MLILIQILVRKIFLLKFISGGASEKVTIKFISPMPYGNRG